MASVVPHRKTPRPHTPTPKGQANTTAFQHPTADPTLVAASADSAALKEARTPPYTNQYTTTNGIKDLYTGARLFRGYMREFYFHDDATAPPGDQIYTLYFFYNPATLYTSIDPSATANSVNNAGAQGAAAMTAAAPGLNAVAVSFQLLIDRSASLFNQPDTFTTRGTSGVLDDVRIFYKILTRGWGGSNANLLPTYSPVRTRFSRHGGDRQPPLGYLGFLSSLNINYTRFNIDMVPTRAEIDVGMNCWVVSPELETNIDRSDFDHKKFSGAGGDFGYTLGRGGLGRALNPYQNGSSTFYLPGAGSRAAWNPSMGGAPTNPSAPPPTTRPAGVGSGNGAPRFQR